MYLGILVPFPIHRNFRMTLFISIKNLAGILMETILNLCINQGNISFHLCRYFLIIFISILYFSAQKLCTCFVRFAPKCSNFCYCKWYCIQNFLFISLFLLYRSKIYFCMCSLYPTTFLNSISNSRNFYFFWKLFGIYYIKNSVTYKLGQFYFFISDLYAFYIFLY